MKNSNILSFKNISKSSPNFQKDLEKYFYKPLMIGVAGGTASGKTTVCKQILKKLECHRVQVISMDSFYRPLSETEHINVSNYNFDHPSAFDWELYRETIQKISLGYVVQIPIYCFCQHERMNKVTVFYPGDVVLFEGILSLYDPYLRNMFSLKIFVSCDADIRVCRRLKRDITERGRSVQGVLHQYEKTVKPSFEAFCAPTKQFADIIIPHGGENEVAINLLVTHIRTQLHFRHPKFNLKKQKSIVPSPQNVNEHMDEINLSRIRDLYRAQDIITIKNLLFDPYNSIIKECVTKAMNNTNVNNLCIICLVPNSNVQILANKYSIPLHFIFEPLKIFQIVSNQTLLNKNRKFDKKSSPKIHAYLMEDIKKKIKTSKHIFIIDALTFSGNRMRSILIWLTEQKVNSQITCISLIGSNMSLELLAHSFRNIKFFTQSKLKELDYIWDLPEEGQWIRTLLC